ncbi:MAG TPA: FG-GAP-like repeat-containing protein [Usitatibacteraceae bacterium]|nr:FG-GAP-like repeat-containing protein [Usitatibacteraceae bacterium]
MRTGNPGARRAARLVPLVPLLATLLLAISSGAQAYSSGVSGYTLRDIPGGGGCSACHGAQNGAVGVSISGPASVLANTTAAYTITVTGIGSSNAGFNAAVTKVAPSPQPTFQAGTGLVTADTSTQVTHNPAKAPVGGTTSWTVNLAIPSGATAGTAYTLYALANAGYGGTLVGWNHAANLVVTVAAALPANPTGLLGSPSSTTTANLTWFGSAAEFVVRRKLGDYPTGPTDAGSTLVYEGTDRGTAFVDTGLAQGTTYYYRVWGKASGSATYSSGHQQTTVTAYSTPGSRYVSVAGNDNAGANTCASPGTPCRTITRAAAASAPGDLVSVAPGTYGAGEVFPISLKSGVQLVATGSPAETVVNGAGDTVKQGLLRFQGNTWSTARVEGFTFRNSLHHAADSCGSPLGGALYVSSSTGTVTVTRNVFSGNEARGYSADGSGGQTGCLAWGGAVAVFASPVNIVNNVFTGNVARGGNGHSHPGTPLSGNEYGGQALGGAIYYSGNGTIANNTFHANYAVGGNGGTGSNGTGAGGFASAGAISASGNPSATIVNNVFSANAAIFGTGPSPGEEASSAPALSADTGVAVVSHNLFHGNAGAGAETLGTASASGNPAFEAAPANLRIRIGSPARAAGTPSGAPAADLDGAARGNPPSIGAFEPFRRSLFWRQAAPGLGLSWWTMEGASPVGTNYHEVDPAWQIADVGDLDGDGKTDALWRRSTDGANYLWTLDGLGFKGFHDLGILSPAQWSFVGVADLDRDGKGDVIWRGADGTVYGWLMNGGTIASQGVISNPGTQWVIADLADMNGDGMADIVFRNVNDGGIYVYLMNGLAISSGVFVGVVDYAAWNLAVADFNGDGKGDFLWKHTSGDTWVWLMNDAVYQSAHPLGNPGASWAVRSLGDFDGDGKADIVWRHTDGTTYLWTMNGGSVTAYLPVPNPGGSWQVVAP